MEKENTEQNGQVSVKDLTDRKIARILSSEHMEISRLQAEIARHQQNIWALNQEIDKRDSQSVVEETG